MFKAINHILFSKPSPEIDGEILEEFSPYLVARYLTFYDSNLVQYANDTVNVLGGIFESKEDQFRFYEHVIPKCKRRKIPYVKRPRPDTDPESIVEFAVPEFYSKREICLLTSQ